MERLFRYCCHGAFYCKWQRSFGINPNFFIFIILSNGSPSNESSLTDEAVCADSSSVLFSTSRFGSRAFERLLLFVIE